MDSLEKALFCIEPNQTAEIIRMLIKNEEYLMPGQSGFRSSGCGNDDMEGLPDTYKPMIMGIESLGLNISADLIKTKLLQDIVTTNSDTALYSNREYKKQFQKRRK
ncbi:unnamed protein product [Colias eurytheme]|nr:unnamed protein product [Colias eurytheme]